MPTSLDRRKFLCASAAGAAAVSLLPAAIGLAEDEDKKKQKDKKENEKNNKEKKATDEKKAKAKKPETLVAELHKSLTEEQRKKVAFQYDHGLRSLVDNNWRIVETRVRDFTTDQQEMIREIFNGLHQGDYVKSITKQVEHDNKGHGGFGGCSVALFGEPGTGKFEFVFTGRHVTRRCDGDSAEGSAFGGPIFYGHAAGGFNEEPDHPGNIYWYQAKRANELFKSFDDKQQRMSLRKDPRQELNAKTVALRGNGELAGIPFTELNGDQQGLFRKVMDDVLLPFRKKDVEEARELIEKAGGFNKLAIAYYENLDVGADRVWDVWQIEGPAMVWYFRGHPHVHTWVNIKESA